MAANHDIIRGATSVFGPALESPSARPGLSTADAALLQQSPEGWFLVNGFDSEPPKALQTANCGADARRPLRSVQKFLRWLTAA